MLDIIRDPYVWFAAASIAGACTGGIVAHLFALYVFSRYPIVEVEPDIDFDALEAELMMDAATLEYQLAADRRMRIVAGLQ